MVCIEKFVRAGANVRNSMLQEGCRFLLTLPGIDAASRTPMWIVRGKCREISSDRNSLSTMPCALASALTNGLLSVLAAVEFVLI
jgi:hypothetical protein